MDIGEYEAQLFGFNSNDFMRAGKNILPLWSTLLHINILIAMIMASGIIPFISLHTFS